MIKIKMSTGSVRLRESGYTIQEEAAVYEAQLQDILDNTRWYLDQESYLPIYKVRWKDYRTSCPTVPFKFITTGVHHTKTNKSDMGL